MYYNPQSTELMEDDELKRFLNVSFPNGEETVMDWHLLHYDAPKVDSNQIVIPDKIEMINGRYVQTYRIEESAETAEPAMDVSIEKRISAIEAGLAELAALLVGEKNQ